MPKQAKIAPSALPILPRRDDGLSWAQFLAQNEALRAEFLAQITDEQAEALRYEWAFWARPNQRDPPETWRFWLIQTGRGWGKTRTGAETVRAWVESGRCRRIALVSDTAADVRDVMIEGPAGIMAVCPPWNKPLYEPSKRRVTWKNGAVAIAYAAEAPELLRGPEHDAAWADELAKWRNLNKRDPEGGTAWSNLLMGLRIGTQPRAIVTTTPRPVKALKELLARTSVVVTRGTSYDNRANLSEDWYQDVITPYEGTRLGRQELYGELLTDTPGALWTAEVLDAHRREMPKQLVRLVLAIDPPGTDRPEGAECGMVAAGITSDGHAYVLHDFSLRATPAGWGRVAVTQYQSLQADRIVAEQNYGGQMVEHTIRTSAQEAGISVSYRHVTATRGKQVRAEPVAALYEQGRVHHVGQLAKLEDELTTWVPGMKSPNRLDACLVAGTRVATPDGTLPIEDIKPGQRVLTRSGYQAVLWAGQTRASAPVWTIEFSDGRTLCGTADHPVWTRDRAFVSLDSLVCGDTIETCETHEKSLSSMACATSERQGSGISGHRARAAEASSIVRCGVRCMAQFLWVVTSIIGMVTPRTTIQRIWRWSRAKSMRLLMRINIVSNAGRGLLRFDRWPLRGMVPMRVTNGTANMAACRGGADNQIPSSVRTAAEWRSGTSRSAKARAIAAESAHGLRQIVFDATNSVWPARFAAPNSGKTNIGSSRRPARVSVVRRYASGIAPVYNLTVANKPEFFANGILVHNCVWALTELLVTAPRAMRVWGGADLSVPTLEEMQQVSDEKLAEAQRVVDEGILNGGGVWFPGD